MGPEGPALTARTVVFKKTAVMIKLFEEPVTQEDMEQGQPLNI